MKEWGVKAIDYAEGVLELLLKKEEKWDYA